MDENLSRLLAATLEYQHEPDIAFDDLAFARSVRDAMAAGTAEQDFPAEVTQLIWRSPTARSIFLQLRAEVVASARRRWRERGFSTELIRMAADSASDESETFSNGGIAMHSVRNAATGRWLISVRLTAEALDDLPPCLRVRVTDRGGKVWLEGVLDRHGGLDGFWDDPETTPRERARAYGLSFDFL